MIPPLAPSLDLERPCATAPRLCAQDRREGASRSDVSRPSVSPSPQASETSRPDGENKRHGASATRPETKACLECGNPFDLGNRPGREFCGTRCRMAFNKRREKRGAEMYDLVMAWRCQRGLAKALGLFAIVCALISQYRQEDRRARGGRKSWRDPRAVIADKPFLKAKASKLRAGK